MGTSNYYNRNASKIFSISDHFQNEETGEMEYDEFIVNDEKDNVFYELKALAEKQNYAFYDAQNAYQDPHELRSYHGTSFAEITESFDFGGVSVNFYLTAVIRSGYYSGANLDWFYTLRIDNYQYTDEIPDEDELTEILANNQNRGISKILAPKLQSKIEKIKNKMVAEMETIFGNYTDKLETVARFSNGETIYKKI